MKTIFTYFIRVNFPEQAKEATHEEIDELGEGFYKFLEFQLTDRQKEKILPKSLAEVLANSNHPLKTKGFDPAYMLHFQEYLKHMPRKF